MCSVTSATRERRLAALERAAATSPGDSIPATRASPMRDAVAQAASASENTDGRGIAGSFRPATNALRDGLTQQTSEGTRFLQRELESNVLIGQDRSAVLRRAIDFVSRISNSGDFSSTTEVSNSRTTGSETEPHKFPPELLYMMTMNPDSEPGVMKRSFWPDHISLETLEKMSLAIMEEREDRQTLICYRICVYLKAVTMISRLPRRDRSAPVRRHLEQSKSQYVDEIHQALRELDFLAPPSLKLLQALLSGALFMQNQGDMSRSWTLTAFASRILVSLNYHTIDRRVASDGQAQDINGALYLCYYLDKILSVLLLRPPSLPRLKITPADLVCLQPRLPLSACVKIMVCFGQVQDGVLDILFNHNESDDQVMAVNSLVQEMEHVRGLMDEPQCQMLARETYFEWLAIEFGYHALLASVLHLQQRIVRGRLARQECLHAARQSLVQLTKLQDEIVIDNNFLGEYPYFLTWQVSPHYTGNTWRCDLTISHRTLLLYPLSPFFIVFCNVIYTRNREDLSLLSKITSGISRFATQSRPVAELHKLFSAFLDLCEPLFNTGSRAPGGGAIPSQSYSMDPTPVLPQSSTTDTEGLLGASLPLPRYDFLGTPNLLRAGDHEVQAEAALYDQPGGLSPSDNELMWDLLQSQPWLGWMRPDT
ncbi:hypothetical protein FE257_004269 [Aspergillus nanangensis]|uniref:Xylanolytic transcriptional activator regulatory domain-containing protein n=1 Tax=Aspergillus nanangensis TaxID=2582783 RepID=A0AAD4CS47_ASPNN|nr:hypothetical protein FE257_004269 [Aspergillus nanangensis]